MAPEQSCSDTSRMVKQWLAATAAGVLFAAGLFVSGMTQPVKVIAFLNFAGLANPERFGPWDSSLAFVMAGALCVSWLAFAITPRPGKKPWFAATFQLPQRRDIDGRLIVGAVLFGIGWGLSGYCPGPAMASLLVGGLDTIIFIAALAAGMWTARRFFA
jgi:uncharacterized membrane protein YedE/YeeE